MAPEHFTLTNGRARLLRAGMTAALVGVCLGVSGALFVKMRADAQVQFYKVFERDAGERAAMLAGMLRERVLDIAALRLFCENSPQLSRAAFAAFTVPLLAARGGGQAFAWAACVPDEQRTGRYPVVYAEPQTGNQAVVGYDLGSEDTRRAALETARDSNALAASARVRLAQEPGARYGVLVCAPVYRPAAPVQTVAQRRAALRGFALGVLQPGALLLAGLNDVPVSGLIVTLCDLAAPPGAQRLCCLDRNKIPAERVDEAQDAQAGLPCHAYPFVFAGRPWRLDIYASPAYERANRSHAYWLALACGLPFSLLLGMYLFTVLWRRERAERLVRDRTSALRESEARFRALFEQAAVGVAMIDTNTGRLVAVNDKYCSILGYAPGELRDRNVRDLSYPEDLKDDAPSLALMIAGSAREVTREKRYFSKNGSMVWTTLAVSPLWVPGESPNFHMAVIQDITERRRNDELLRAERERAQRYLDIAPTIILALDTAHSHRSISCSAQLLAQASRVTRSL